VTLLRQAGASKVTLVGASMGAPVDGVVALSPEEDLRGPFPSVTTASRCCTTPAWRRRY
jgi:hypothetical protein